MSGAKEIPAIVFLAFFLNIVGQSPVQSTPTPVDLQQIPTEEGIYVKSPSGWTRMQAISSSGGGMKHAAKMFVPGLTPQVVWTFRGAEAPVQLSDSRPTFCIRQQPMMDDIAGHSARDVIIVRFDRKKDHRELQTTSGGNAVTFKSGFSKEKTPDISVSTPEPGIILVTPMGDLPPGEYLLTFGSSGFTGFDFGTVLAKNIHKR
ncbi:MAG: hypothetical protein ACRD50_15500 [Candidatus Acidiferrales bacterium]